MRLPTSNIELTNFLAQRQHAPVGQIADADATTTASGYSSYSLVATYYGIPSKKKRRRASCSTQRGMGWVWSGWHFLAGHGRERF
jgi:hypothetical protein